MDEERAEHGRPSHAEVAIAVATAIAVVWMASVLVPASRWPVGIAVALVVAGEVIWSGIVDSPRRSSGIEVAPQPVAAPAASWAAPFRDETSGPVFGSVDLDAFLVFLDDPWVAAQFPTCGTTTDAEGAPSPGSSC